MKPTAIRPFLYLTSALLLLGGLAVIHLFLRDHRYYFYFMAGYAALSLFFFGLKISLVKLFSRHAPPPTDQERSHG